MRFFHLIHNNNTQHIHLSFLLKDASFHFIINSILKTRFLSFSLNQFHAWQIGSIPTEKITIHHQVLLFQLFVVNLRVFSVQNPRWFHHQVLLFQLFVVNLRVFSVQNLNWFTSLTFSTVCCKPELFFQPFVIHIKWIPKSLKNHQFYQPVYFFRLETWVSYFEKPPVLPVYFFRLEKTWVFLLWKTTSFTSLLFPTGENLSFPFLFEKHQFYQSFFQL